jgi:DNA (cytosine-5)-methyltransferase 1
LATYKFGLVDLFCGCGGLSLGLEAAGFEVLSGNDFDEPMIRSFAHNHPGTKAVHGDITKLSSEEFEIDAKTIDVIAGGPPCQGFSTVGDRRRDDPRNRLFYEFVRIVGDLKPQVVILENVTGILTMEGGNVRRRVVEEFENLGYSMTHSVLKAEDYGVPQRRRRVFFVGNLRKKKFRFPNPTHFCPEPEGETRQLTLVDDDRVEKKKWVTVWDAIGDLPSLHSNESKDSYASDPTNEYQKRMRRDCSKLTDHKSPNHSEIMVERMRHIPQGGNHSDLPERLRLSSGYPNIYGRLRSDEPSDTITGNCGCISAPGRFIHPFDNRAISVREAMRLQSFPDRWVVFGSQNKKYKQVGNAVPPILAEALGKQIIAELLT